MAVTVLLLRPEGDTPASPLMVAIIAPTPVTPGRSIDMGTIGGFGHGESGRNEYQDSG